MPQACYCYENQPWRSMFVQRNDMISHLNTTRRSLILSRTENISRLLPMQAKKLFKDCCNIFLSGIVTGLTRIMKFLSPSVKLTDEQTQSGLRYIVKESLAGEVMVNLTGGTFLVSMAVFMGASNFQIGLLASLPIFTNVFQLASIWLVHTFNNRRAIAVLTSVVARLALLIIGAIPFVFGKSANVNFLIALLTVHYFFGSLASASWNSWMKDLVPEKTLGQYFSYRTRLMQILSITTSLLVAFFIDFMKVHHPDMVNTAYFVMFLVGSGVGMLGVYLLSKAPEPKAEPDSGKVLTSFQKPLRDRNFRKLIFFNSFWSFALDLAVPFFSVYMMKTIGLPLSYVMAFTILGQLSSISSLKLWGRYTDRYSNKTIIRICAPVYISCIMAMAFTSLPSGQLYSIILLAVINIFSGISTAGINLAVSNIGIKLAPREDAMSYMAVKNIIVSLCAAMAPLLAGMMADYFSHHELEWNFQWQGAHGVTVIQMISLKGLNFFFVIGGLLAMLSLRLLPGIKEQGEVEKDRVVGYMHKRIRSGMRENLVLRSIASYRPGKFSVLLKKRFSEWQ
ncbi:MFS transporter [Arcticibacter tournemirensis]|uniref:MFS transporter n=2 Tax=Arcticibacter tournemirensis TaxID=699437 RepID=A0A4Q0MFW1_9SPHI|nr:MFS transporter [Arcticibacter tournemirensis]